MHGKREKITGHRGYPNSAVRRYGGLLALPAALMYWELLLRGTAGIGLTGSNAIAGLLTALSLGCALTVFCTLTPSARANRGIGFVLLELCALLFLVAHFLNASYQVFMTPAAVLSGAGDVMAGFGDTLVTLLSSGVPVILLYHLPVVLYLILARHYVNYRSTDLRQPALLLALALLCWGISVPVATARETDRLQYTEQYGFDSAVRNFGLLTALRLEARYGLFGNPYESSFVLPPAEPPELPGSAVPTPGPVPLPDPVPDGGEQGGAAVPPEETGDGGEVPPAQPVEYGWNMLDIDFAALAETAESDTLRELHTYVSGLVPDRKNACTGLFAGKNLILITAEAFARELIDPELTPTLYRLANRGIVFEDYYQPAWGGSTATGEYSILTGLVPTQGINSYKNTQYKNMYMTMGNQLQRLGYFSRAYHNGDYTYYDRHMILPNLGYEQYIAMGSGMEEGVARVWPASDLEMMQFTVEQYLDRQPFSVYYMTVSGHCLYSNVGNSMSYRNREAVSHLECSDTVKAYYAANLELEYALTALVDTLEQAGIADDTVIVLSTDHYPYGLEESPTWGNDRDYLAELYGYPADSNPARDHSALLIWSGCLEQLSEPIVVSDPVYSLDILPTLCNLFGLEYDSRLLVGRDALSDTEALVLWSDYSWKTAQGYYDARRGVFTPAEGAQADETYVARIQALVRNKMVFSNSAMNCNYYEAVFGGELGN